MENKINCQRDISIGVSLDLGGVMSGETSIKLLQGNNFKLRQQNLSLQIENREFRKQIEKIQRNDLVKTINELQGKLRVEQHRNTNLINRYELKKIINN